MVLAILGEDKETKSLREGQTNGQAGEQTSSSIIVLKSYSNCWGLAC